jgi:arginine N-succinyltransferase
MNELLERHLWRGIGLDRPRHWYHLGSVVHAASELKLYRVQRTLLLGNDLTGAHELVDLQALPPVRVAALVAAALAECRRGDRLIAELPGLRAAGGRSPFWEGLGARFCPVTPAEAQARHGPDGQRAVAALLPRQPIYVSFLPEAAQAAVAACADDMVPLRQALEAAGLHWHGHLRIDDGGPVLERVAT